MEFLTVMASIVSIAAALTRMLEDGVGAWQQYRHHKIAKPVRSDPAADVDSVPDPTRLAGADSNAR